MISWILFEATANISVLIPLMQCKNILLHDAKWQTFHLKWIMFCNDFRKHMYLSSMAKVWIFFIIQLNSNWILRASIHFLLYPKALCWCYDDGNYSFSRSWNTLEEHFFSQLKFPYVIKNGEYINQFASSVIKYFEPS